MTEAHMAGATAMTGSSNANPHILAWRYLIALIAIAFIAFLPLLALFAASVVANANGCKLDEGNPHPCLILGRDAGPSLYNIAVGGWLMIFTLPIGAGFFVSWLLLLALHSWRRRKRSLRLTQR